MKLLLDTHLLLWAAVSPDRLSDKVRTLLSDVTNDLVFSAASLWEVSIKHGLDRANFTVDPRLLRRGLLENGYSELPITSQHALAIAYLPKLHRDPFDRLLVAQSAVEAIVLLTADVEVAAYGGLTRLV